MNLVDISSWQKGLDLSALFARNPALDGVEGYKEYIRHEA